MIALNTDAAIWQNYTYCTYQDLDWLSCTNKLLILVLFLSYSHFIFLLQPVLATNQLFRTATITSCISIINYSTKQPGRQVLTKQLLINSPLHGWSWSTP